VPNTVINPYTVVVLNRKSCEIAVKKSAAEKNGLAHSTSHSNYHSQNASFADTAMVRSRRFIVGTFLAVSQITTLQ
jgi:hypothetical protein